MPQMRRSLPPMFHHAEQVPVPEDPLDWRPQLARQTSRQPEVHDPIIEPDWDGLRVLAHVEVVGPRRDEVRVRLIDVDGKDATDNDADVRDALARSVLALDAVIDGVITEQATRSGIGAAIINQPKAPRTALLMKGEVTIEVDTAPVERGDHVAFVAVDLLRLDGQVLTDLPLLERKRLLDGLIEQGDLVRVTPFTRPPLGPWLSSWKSAGFKGLLMKASNSRYRPNSYTDEWTAVSKVHVR